MSYEECKLALMLLGYRPMKCKYHNFVYNPHTNEVSVPEFIHEGISRIHKISSFSGCNPLAISYQNIVDVMTERLDDS